ncbi:MAG: selenide, water dikinase SelD [candidate division WOR-3 bacterium]
MSKAQLAQALSGLEVSADPRLLVGISTADDAGVFMLQPGLAVVQTVDILTPMVEDPYVFGRIAAANSLSDVYAMGGEPVTVLNIIGFPAAMDKAVLREILRGGQDTVKMAGAVVVGGHTFNEKEIKYGLSVTGRVDPDKIITNAGARIGDRLVLTKPLGTGVFAQIMMIEETIDTDFYRAAVESMMQLNKTARDLMLEFSANAATDITGYGFLGHLQELAEASEVRVRVYSREIPMLPAVRELADRYIDSGVAMNEASFSTHVEWKCELPDAIRNLLWESESSGGLLISLPAGSVDLFQQKAFQLGVLAAVVGEVISGSPGTIEVV